MPQGDPEPGGDEGRSDVVPAIGRWVGVAQVAGDDDVMAAGSAQHQQELIVSEWRPQFPLRTRLQEDSLWRSWVASINRPAVLGGIEVVLEPVIPGVGCGVVLLDDDRGLL